MIPPFPKRWERMGHPQPRLILLVRPERPYVAGAGDWLLLNPGKHRLAVKERQTPVEGAAAVDRTVGSTQFADGRVHSVVGVEQCVRVAHVEIDRTLRAVRVRSALILRR